MLKLALTYVTRRGVKVLRIPRPVITYIRTDPTLLASVATFHATDAPQVSLLE